MFEEYKTDSIQEALLRAMVITLGRNHPSIESIQELIEQYGIVKDTQSQSSFTVSMMLESSADFESEGDDAGVDSIVSGFDDEMLLYHLQEMQHSSEVSSQVSSISSVSNSFVDESFSSSSRVGIEIDRGDNAKQQVMETLSTLLFSEEIYRQITEAILKLYCPCFHQSAITHIIRHDVSLHEILEQDEQSELWVEFRTWICQAGFDRDLSIVETTGIPITLYLLWILPFIDRVERLVIASISHQKICQSPAHAVSSQWKASMSPIEKRLHGRRSNSVKKGSRFAQYHDLSHRRLSSSASHQSMLSNQENLKKSPRDGLRIRIDSDTVSMTGSHVSNRSDDSRSIFTTSSAPSSPTAAATAADLYHCQHTPHVSQKARVRTVPSHYATRSAWSTDENIEPRSTENAKNKQSDIKKKKERDRSSSFLSRLFATSQSHPRGTDQKTNATGTILTNLQPLRPLLYSEKSKTTEEVYKQVSLNTLTSPTKTHNETPWTSPPCSPSAHAFDLDLDLDFDAGDEGFVSNCSPNHSPRFHPIQRDKLKAKDVIKQSQTSRPPMRQLSFDLRSPSLSSISEKDDNDEQVGATHSVLRKDSLPPLHNKNTRSLAKHLLASSGSFYPTTSSDSFWKRVQHDLMSTKKTTDKHEDIKKNQESKKNLKKEKKRRFSRSQQDRNIRDTNNKKKKEQEYQESKHENVCYL
jgi:hypothetical protein